MAKLTVFCHFRNEEFLLPYWIRHHSELFDHGVLVDWGSTDRSAGIARELAPHWDLVSSRNSAFDAARCDQEMMDLERRHEGWKIVLNVTEQLFCDDLRGHLASREATMADGVAIAIRIATMVDSPHELRAPLTEAPLYFQRFHGYFDEDLSQPWRLARLHQLRYLHRYPDGAYETGRHATRHPYDVDEELLILKFAWAPYQQVRHRKLQLQENIPGSDAVRGYGLQHLVTPEELDLQYEIEAEWAKDLTRTEPFARVLVRLARRHGVKLDAPAGGEAEPPPEVTEDDELVRDAALPVSAVAYRHRYRRLRQLEGSFLELVAEHERLNALHDDLWKRYRELAAVLQEKDRGAAG